VVLTDFRFGFASSGLLNTFTKRSIRHIFIAAALSLRSTRILQLELSLKVCTILCAAFMVELTVADSSNYQLLLSLSRISLGR
jgi:hypothetical protein